MKKIFGFVFVLYIYLAVRLIFLFVVLCPLRVLENITGYIINIDDINYYKDKDGNYDYER